MAWPLPWTLGSKIADSGLLEGTDVRMPHTHTTQSPSRPLTHPFPLSPSAYAPPQAEGVVDALVQKGDAVTPTNAQSVLPGTTATATSATPVLDGAISSAANSNNAGLQTAGMLANMAKQSGLISGANINKVKAANPELGAVIGAFKTGAEIAQGVNQCYASIEGQDSAISSALLSLGTSAVNSDAIEGAMGLGSAFFAASGKTATQQEAIYQLFRIYLDQNANTGKALTATQEKAYSSLTPACNAAFDDIVTSYADSKGTVTSLLAGGNSNITCSNFQEAKSAVDMTLCVWPTAIWANEDKIYANLTATFTNYGVALCDVSFYIINLAGQVGLKPTWLPNSATAFPDGIPKETEIAIAAAVPWSAEIANDAPVVDILKGWSACPNGRATPAPTAARTEKPKVNSGVMDSASACFITPACQTAVAPYAADSCGAYTSS